MKKSHLISPLYLLPLLNSATSQRDMYAGFWINFENQKNCTASFIVNKQGVNGLLTSARCCVNNNCLNGNTFDTAYENEDDGKVTKIGQVHDAQFGGNSGLDYAFITLDSPDWSPFLYTAGLAVNDTINNGTITELYPVTSDFTPTELGLAVCASGQSSGYLCGNLTEFDLTLTVANPWKNSSTFLKGVNKVDLGTTGFASEEDLGGPVYVQSDNSGVITAQALGHIVATNNDDPNHKILYYLPIDKILNATSNKLLTHTFEEKEEKLDNEIEYIEWNDTLNKDSIADRATRWVYAGVPINIGNPKWPCTASFAVTKNGWNKGILTAGHCSPYGNVDEIVYVETTRGAWENIGDMEVVSFADKDGNDFAFVNIYPNNNWASLACIYIPDESGTPQLLPVTSSFNPTKVDTKVCAFGATNFDLICGKIIRTNATASLRNPVTDSKYTITGMTLVSGEKVIKGGDSGGPVFIKTIGGEAVQAVGHLVGGGAFKGGGIYFYMPLKKILKSSHNLKLITTKSCVNSRQKKQTEQNQTAQIEVPPKQN